jgi:hypothetical protein
MDQHIQQTIADAQARLRDQEEAVSQTKKLINQLCTFGGVPPIYPDVEAASASAVHTALLGHEYLGKAQSTACRMILERRGQNVLGPATVEDLYADMVAGGYEFTAKNPTIAKRSLHQMLTKNTAMFFRLRSGKFGLASWYPEATRRRKPKEGNEGAEVEESENEDSPPDEGEES